MKFARIEMLFLIWAVPLFFLVFLYGMKKRRNIMSRFASAKGLQAIAPGIFSNRRWIKAGLILCVLLFLTLALSGPQYGYNWQEVERKGIDIIIALDCSKSMLAADIKPTRLDRAKREVYDLLTMLQGDRIGLVAFAGTAFLQCPLTLDYEAFNIFLNTLTPDFLPVGGTDITGAVSASLSGFDEKSNSEKAVILITDGEDTGEGDPAEAARNAEKAGVKMFCIGVGSEGGVPVPDSEGGLRKDKSGQIVLTKLDEDTLKKMSVLTGGTYVRSVAGDMDLDAVYTNEIRGKMENSTLQSGRKQIWEDRYQWLLALAIIALTAELFLPSTKKTASALILAFLFVLNPIPILTSHFSLLTSHFPLLTSHTSHLAYAGPVQDGLDSYEKGEYEKALKLFIDAQLEDPDKPEILYNIGNAYYKTGDYDSAANSFKQTLKSEDIKLRHKAYYNLGNSNFKKDNLEEAIKNYQEAIKLDSNDEKAKQNLEFAKKVMELKKQQEQQKKQDQDKDQDKDQNKDQNKEDQEKESEDQKDGSEDDQKEKEKSGKEDNKKESDQEEPSPEYGDEKEADQESGSKQEKGDKENDEEKNEIAKANPSENPEESGDKKQAEHMLNRLKDQPGRAMIPVYREKHVKKDW